MTNEPKDAMRSNHRLLTVCLTLLLLAASACSIDEGYIKRRVTELEQLEGKADKSTKAKIVALKQELRQALDKLPEGEGRKEALSKLGRKARKQVAAAKELLKANVAAADKEQQAKLGDYRKLFNGQWRGEGMQLNIAPSGKVGYKRKKGSSSRSVTAKITKFGRDKFKVGVLGINTTFTIDKPPAQQGGVWKMTIDGVELTRVDAVARPRFGLEVCTKVKGRVCVDPAQEFPLSTGKLYVVFAAKKVPKDGQKFTVIWLTEDVGKAAPPNFAIAKTPVVYKATKERATHFSITGNLSRPTKGWPPGSYRVEIRSEKTLIISAGFRMAQPKGEAAPATKTP